MSTAIAVVPNQFACITPGSREMAIIEENLDGEPIREMDLVKVSTPAGGGTTWSINADGNEEKCDEIVGVLVGVFKRGYLWPSEDPTEMKPVIITNDFVTGYRVSDDLGSIDPAVLEKYRTGDGTYDWAAMSSGPDFGFGTARGGHGKRVKEHRLLAILRDGDLLPILVNVGGGSLTDVLRFLRTRLPSFRHECILGLKLVKEKSAGGQVFSKIVPRVVGTIPQELGDVAKRLYVDPLAKMFAEPPYRGGKAASGDNDAPF